MLWKCRAFSHFTYRSLSELGTRWEPADFIRDVGVAGSNPVTPTITKSLESQRFRAIGGAPGRLQYARVVPIP